MDDLAVIVVSTNEGRWLRACLGSVLSHRGECQLDLVVVDNDSTDDTRSVVAEFPEARIVSSTNRGFAHANNRGLMTTDARYALFLNPDTEVRVGTFADLVRALDERPEIGLVGVVQLDSDGQVYPTIRRFPNALRALGAALGGERFPIRPKWLLERELDRRLYARETDCDWTSGSFMFARREALESAGFMDERFFIYSEEPDLCLRLKGAGWKIRHLPQMTIVHHAGKAGIRPRMAAQDAYTRKTARPKALLAGSSGELRDHARFGLSGTSTCPGRAPGLCRAAGRSPRSPSRAPRHRRSTLRCTASPGGCGQGASQLAGRLERRIRRRWIVPLSAVTWSFEDRGPRRCE